MKLLVKFFEIIYREYRLPTRADRCLVSAGVYRGSFGDRNIVAALHKTLLGLA